MATYEIKYDGERRHEPRDARVFAVTVWRDGEYLGVVAGALPGIDWRREFSEPDRRRGLYFNGAIRLLADLVADEIVRTGWREEWAPEVPMYGLSGPLAQQRVDFESNEDVYLGDEVIRKVET
jgi:hypothetical protein